MPAPTYKSYTTVDNGISRTFDIIDLSGAGFGPYIPAADNSYTGAIALAVDVAATTLGRSLLINCTAAGNVNITFVDGTTLVIAIEVGTIILPFVVSKILSTSTTAAATFAVLR